jgi:hypothetical protein
MFHDPLVFFSAGGHQGCFWFFFTPNKAVNVRAQVFMDMFSLRLGRYLGVRRLIVWYVTV